jgi:hypothetical protein
MVSRLLVYLAPCIAVKAVAVVSYSGNNDKENVYMLSTEDCFGF